MANPWPDFTTPAPGEARAIGAYQAGCLHGGKRLSPEEPRVELMRPGRGRHYGHPALLELLRALARDVETEGYGAVLIGDLSMPRGGPTMTGHVSHQSGLDADVWYRVQPPGARLDASERHTLPAPGYVDTRRGDVNARWGPPQDALVRFAARSAEVERIFVNAAIKRHFCRTETGDRSWLRKLRPWWGHADHMHVRLRCPPDSRECEPQEPPPPGDGCDVSLDWWFTQDAADALAERRKKRTRRQVPELPAACGAVARQ